MSSTAYFVDWLLASKIGSTSTISSEVIFCFSNHLHDQMGFAIIPPLAPTPGAYTGSMQ
jgi:hypothetical protein